MSTVTRMKPVQWLPRIGPSTQGVRLDLVKVREALFCGRPKSDGLEQGSGLIGPGPPAVFE